MKVISQKLPKYIKMSNKLQMNNDSIEFQSQAGLSWLELTSSRTKYSLISVTKTCKKRIFSLAKSLRSKKGLVLATMLRISLSCKSQQALSQMSEKRSNNKMRRLNNNK